MKTAPYWARAASDPGTPVHVICRSEHSVEDAEREARRRGNAVAFRIAHGQSLMRYPYGTGPLPEPVLEEIRDGQQRTAIITRNSYGARILNTAQLVRAFLLGC